MASVTEVDYNNPHHSVPIAGDKPVVIEQRTVRESYNAPVQQGAYAPQRLDPDSLAVTQPQTRIFLRPLASPSCLGMACFFAGTWVFSTYILGWYGSDNFNIFYHVFPFIAVFGGLAQFIAGYYGFPARDNLVTVYHVSWGSFYIAYGLLILVQITGYNNNTGLPIPFSLNTQQGPATWLVVMAGISWAVCLASLGRDFLIFLITLFQAVGSTLMFAGWYADSVTGAVKTGGYFMMASSVLALFYTFLCLVVEAAAANPSAAAYGDANRRPYAWRQGLSNWRGRMPWVAADPGVRIPIAEPGIKKDL